MAICAHCKRENTELYENNVPICLKCESAKHAKTRGSAPVQRPGIQAALVQDLLKATALADKASLEFNAAIRDSPRWPPQPDGTQHLKNISHELTGARNEIMKAHNRLVDYLERGVVPEGLKGAGEG